MNKGDIVLIPFPFTDLTGAKNRPALDLIETESDITVSFITTQLRWNDENDVVLEPTPLNGLKKSSLLKLSKFATIDKDLVIGKLGHLSEEELIMIDSKLRALFKIGR